MKEATLTSAHIAETIQPIISWKRVIRTATRIAGRTVLTIIQHEATPWVLTAITALLMWWGWAVDDFSLHKWSAAATLPFFSWGLFRESKNINPDEL
ncbi:MAG: hypothetical protein E7081_02595 [Bacteroidales bacterium]|nr:hypothetical protein [Bacteroidales bacterium]